jgi:integrase
MVLNDTGCSIGELVQLRKSDVDIEKNPIEIKVQARYIKTKKARIMYITKETTPVIRRLLNKKQYHELVLY